jgi:hypothetical protein
MCGLGVGPRVPPGNARWFSYAYFEFVPHACAGITPYPSSQLVPLEAARLLTPLLGLPGTVNLIALGLLSCVIASFGIASLATGLRLRPWAQLAVAAAVWLIMADAAFFDVYASPFSEPAALIGLLLVAAGVVYLGRSRGATVFGLIVAGTGGFLAVLAKEQYLILAIPICLTLVLASAARGAGRGRRRFRTRQVAAAAAVAALLAMTAAAYGLWDTISPLGQRLHQKQAVNMIFEDIVTRHDNARADLRALGLPASWARYAGHSSFSPVSVRRDPRYPRYAARLSDGNIAHFLLTHPGDIISVGQHAAVLAQRFRVTTLGNYAPGAGHPRGATESRVVALSWLVHQLPARLGLLWLVPAWTAMAAIAIAALTRRRERTWHRDGAVMVLCMTGCAIAAFIPPAYFDGISTTRHMVGMNMATAIAFPVSIALALSMARRRDGGTRPAVAARDSGDPARGTGSCWPGGSVPELPENTGQVRAVCLAEPVECSFCRCAADRADRIEDTRAVPGQLDQGGPPVVGVGAPFDQAASLQGIGNLGGRARRDAQVLRERRQAHLPVPRQHAHRPQLRRGDVPGSQRLLGRFAQLARDGPERFGQRLVTAGVAGPGRTAAGRAGPGLRVAVLGHGNSVSAIPVVASY